MTSSRICGHATHEGLFMTSPKRKNPGLIVYWSKYGSTKQYAVWLREETGFVVRSASRPAGNALKKARIIIAGGAIRNGRLKIVPWIRRHWNSIKSKTVIVYSTSGLPVNDPVLQDIWQKCLPHEIRSACQYVPLPGRLDYGKLHLRDKIVMKIGAFMQGDKEIMSGMRMGFDAVDRNALLPILAKIKATFGGQRN
jgi:menaquinone-dependent protoporphyrinogen IX oxidase